MKQELQHPIMFIPQIGYFIFVRRNMLRKNRIIISVGAVILILTAVYIIKSSYEDPDLRYSQEYNAGTGNIKGNVDIEYFVNKSADFAIGANHYGFAVFKKPDAALAKLKTDYKAGIDLIQREFKLSPLSQSNYKLYGTYGWQVTSGTKEEKEQAAFVSSFVDIYENSFNKQ